MLYLLLVALLVQHSAADSLTSSATPNATTSIEAPSSITSTIQQQVTYSAAGKLSLGIIGNSTTIHVHPGQETTSTVAAALRKDDASSTDLSPSIAPTTSLTTITTAIRKTTATSPTRPASISQSNLRMNETGNRNSSHRESKSETIHSAPDTNQISTHATPTIQHTSNANTSPTPILSPPISSPSSPIPEQPAINLTCQQLQKRTPPSREPGSKGNQFCKTNYPCNPTLQHFETCQDKQCRCLPITCQQNKPDACINLPQQCKQDEYPQCILEPFLYGNQTVCQCRPKQPGCLVMPNPHKFCQERLTCVGGRQSTSNDVNLVYPAFPQCSTGDEWEAFPLGKCVCREFTCTVPAAGGDLEFCGGYVRCGEGMRAGCLPKVTVEDMKGGKGFCACGKG